MLNRMIAIVCMAVVFHPAAALASPTPSPSLSGILAPPPTADYVEAAPTSASVLEGQFDATTFGVKLKVPNAAQVEQTLARDGFVDGFWRTWQKGHERVLLEMVIAFSGRDGAKSWLRGAEATDKLDADYLHPLSISGIDEYYGAHFYYKSSRTYGDWYAFVKGNDYFGLVIASAHDDLGTSAADQTKAQYAFAPAATIPQSQWPESRSSTVAFNVGSLLGGGIVLVLLAGLVLFVVGLARRSRRQTSFAGSVPGAGVQMSPDGRYWWDGQSWRDAQVQVPPSAQRSADGHFWWDGKQWRPVP